MLMSADNSKSIMIVGAHAGDAELMAGGVAAKYAGMGHAVTLVHMTLGEKGHPTMRPEDYAVQKEREAREAARVLGAGVRFMPYKDGELNANDEAKYALCDVIREVKPNLIVTHWKGSIHKDHTATYDIVQDAVFYAALPAISRKLPAHGCWRLFYAENWEDPRDFDIDTYVDVAGFMDVWEEAVTSYQFVKGGISRFRYLDYYKALMAMRGCLSNYQVAEGFMSPPGALIRKGPGFPGF